MIFNLFKKKASSPSVTDSARPAVSKELDSEVFDPKAMIPPNGGVRGDLIEYYVFCKDDKSEKDKEFPYHKKVVCDCSSMQEAEKLAKVFTVHYQHYAIAYNVTKHEIASEVHEGSKKLFLARIKEFREFRAGNVAERASLAALIAVKPPSKA